MPNLSNQHVCKYGNPILLWHCSAAQVKSILGIKWPFIVWLDNMTSSLWDGAHYPRYLHNWKHRKRSANIGQQLTALAPELDRADLKTTIILSYWIIVLLWTWVSLVALGENMFFKTVHFCLGFSLSIFFSVCLLKKMSFQPPLYNLYNYKKKQKCNPIISKLLESKPLGCADIRNEPPKDSIDFVNCCRHPVGNLIGQPLDGRQQWHEVFL